LMEKAKLVVKIMRTVSFAAQAIHHSIVTGV